MRVPPTQAHRHGKYDNNGKGLSFRFDDENKMNYKCILMITKTLMGQFNIYNPTCYEENKDGVQEN